MIVEKKILRKKYKVLRDSIEADVRASESKKIAELLYENEFYKKAETVFIYVSFGSEAETADIIKRAFADGKRVAVPLCDTKLKIMSAIEIDGMDGLSTGAYGIMEPRDKSRTVAKNEIDVVIAPALSFDKSGVRLGYGGGYYDKFLKDFCGISVGLCYSECLADKLPAEEFDCRVDRVICPERMI